MVCSCLMNDKKYWGPTIWNLLHAIGDKLTKIENINNGLNLIKNIYLLLPCNECKQHAKEYLETNQLILSNITNLEQCRKEIKEYLFNFHNNVNSRLNKIIFTSFEQYCNENDSKKLLERANYSNIANLQINKANKEFYQKNLNKDELLFNSNVLNMFMNL